MMCIREEMNEEICFYLVLELSKLQRPTKYKIPNLYLIDQFIFLNFKFVIPFRLASKSLGTC